MIVGGVPSSLARDIAHLRSQINNKISKPQQNTRVIAEDDEFHGENKMLG